MAFKKIYIGAICNRDLELLDKIKSFSKINYNIEIINLLKKEKKVFKIKSFKKKLKKYSISFLIVKLLSGESNEVIYNALKIHSPHIPVLNSLKSVQLCESRRDTFQLIEKRHKTLHIPKTYYSAKDANDACAKGTKIIIKFDVHNAPHLAKRDRIIGIAKSPKEFKELTKNFKEEHLFFQEFLGDFDTFYKTYVINRWVGTITSQTKIQQELNLTPVELVHIRVPTSQEFKNELLKLGRIFRMQIFGVDYILKNGIPYIVDVNDFPGFKHSPEAVSLISNYIYHLLITQQKFQEILINEKLKQV